MINTYGLPLPIPCVYNGPPIKLNSSTVETLKMYIPEFTSKGDDSLFCCDDDQVSHIMNQMSIPKKLMERCPSCFYNFVRLFFFMTCAPNQHQFIKVTESTDVPKSDQKQVSTLDYHLTKEYAHGLYNSCVEVVMPSTGQKVVPVLMCQPLKPNEKCNPERFLTAIGTKGVSPMKINFMYSTGDSIVPNNHTISKCSEAPKSYSNLSCSCIDCSALCPPPIVLPEDTSQWTISGVDGMAIVMGVIYGIIFILSLLSFIIYYRIYHHEEVISPSELQIQSDSLDQPRDKNLDLTKIDIDSEELSMFAKFFGAYGSMCVRRPYCYLFPLIGLLIGVSMSIGMVKFDPITDPIKLWSTSTSRARIEKDIYDTNFGPFYRPETVVITPTNLTEIVHNDRIYGPVFDQTFLRNVFKLQQKIMDITIVGRNNKIMHTKDLCYSPMNNSICMVQSAIGWFQNDQKLIDRPDYIDHMDNCIASPFAFNDSIGLACMAPYGGPVFPHIALGDYQGNNYTQAKALVITVTINNAINDADKEDALKWESEYLDLLLGYNDSSFSLAFYAEVSFSFCYHVFLC